MLSAMHGAEMTTEAQVPPYLVRAS